MTDQKLKDIQKMDFEAAFIALQENVTQLEGEDLPLEQALACFERGQALAKRCAELLEKAELKVQQLAMETPQEPKEVD
ncbi:MAG: exodeoxyribonuclease VII small subunit [Chloroflexota bacterium]|nr:exodeoxyribonuclease VII small subunit [Chloroflexota bacterium]